MTIVVASRFLKTVVIVADCRVSYQGMKEVDDNLQKIYQIDKRMVLGFSGPLAGAYQVMEAIRRNLSKYSKRPIASNLRADVQRWIKHEYQAITQPKDRENLSFVLATVEPRREVRATWRTIEGKEIPKPKWFPFIPELYILTLKPAPGEPDKLTSVETGIWHIIGASDEAQDAVRVTVEKLFDFASWQPNLQAQAIVNALMATLMEKQIVSVGGLFQGALLSVDGIQWVTYGLPSRFGDVTLDIVDGHYIQLDNVTGKEVPLETIWDWRQKWRPAHLPGNSGVFEDPAMRRAFGNRNDDFSKSSGS